MNILEILQEAHIEGGSGEWDGVVKHSVYVKFEIVPMFSKKKSVSNNENVPDDWIEIGPDPDKPETHTIYRTSEKAFARTTETEESDLVDIPLTQATKGKLLKFILDVQQKYKINTLQKFRKGWIRNGSLIFTEKGNKQEVVKRMSFSGTEYKKSEGQSVVEKLKDTINKAMELKYDDTNWQGKKLNIDQGAVKEKQKTEYDESINKAQDRSKKISDAVNKIVAKIDTLKKPIFNDTNKSISVKVKGQSELKVLFQNINIDVYLRVKKYFQEKKEKNLKEDFKYFNY
ncbi:MAG: hypothetical protein LBF97_03620 [Elusimicrobiota bacterium]|jgi:hypothetical protein|nr:hypothetical protein [Elusimicrobiota bacterium]